MSVALRYEDFITGLMLIHWEINCSKKEHEFKGINLENCGNGTEKLHVVYQHSYLHFKTN